MSSQVSCCSLLLAGALLWPAATLAADAPTAPGRAGPLATLTIATNALAPARLFYRDGFGLELTGPVPLDSATRSALARLWGLPAGTGFTEYLFSRRGVAEAARIRLLVLDRASPSVRSSWDPAVLGPYTIGFANVRQAEVDARLRALGFGARNPMERSPFTNGDGRSWEVLETVHTGPDFVAAVGIARGGGNAPISPVDETGLGGPTYSMMVVADLERMAGFLHDTLGYEIHNRRLQTSAGSHGSLNTPDGTQMEIARLSPAVGSYGFLILLQFRNLAVSAPPVAPRLPATGLTLYSFPVDRLEPVLARAAAGGATSIAGPLLVDNPPNGKTRHASFIAPNGVMFELFEQHAAWPHADQVPSR